MTNKITKYFQETYTEHDNTSDKNKDDKNIPYKMFNPFTKTEVIEAVKKLKNNKSPGHDQITTEQLKNAPHRPYYV